MATYGAKYIKFAPIANEPATDLPTYHNAIVLSELQKVSDNPSFNEASQPGDNRTVEYVSEFKEADVDVEITDLDNDMQQGVLGASFAGSGEDKDLEFGIDDNPPYGGLGFVNCRIRKNVKSYQGILYSKVKATMQGEEYSTKGDSITLAGGKLKFKSLAPEYGKWKVKSPYFASEAEAKAWVDSKLPDKA
jgi:hypothetical protein